MLTTWRPLVLAMVLIATTGRAQEDAATHARVAVAIGDTARTARFLHRWVLLADDSVSLTFIDRRPPERRLDGHRLIREMVIYDEEKKAAAVGARSILTLFEISCASGHLRSRRTTFFSDHAGTQVASIDSVPEDWGDRPPPRDPQSILVAKACE